MPTDAELKLEKVWRDQLVPDSLKILVQRLEVYFDPTAINIGAYGDTRHLSGYHRSRAWIFGSKYARNRTYSVTETAGNRGGGNSNWISGLDIVVGQVRSEMVWRRINTARQHGQIPYVLQCLLERDPHHVHLSLDRAHAADDHTRLFQIITGAWNPEVGKVSFEVSMPTLERGAKGKDVITAQALLNARGHSTDLDGDFGPHTEEQTRAMQARYGAEAVDGIWGRETWTIGMTGEDRL